jgi:hypothetical protein
MTHAAAAGDGASAGAGISPRFGAVRCGDLPAGGLPEGASLAAIGGSGIIPVSAKDSPEPMCFRDIADCLPDPQSVSAQLLGEG